MNQPSYQPQVAPTLTSTPLLTAAEEYQLLTAYHAGRETAAGLAARERLIMSNMGLVYKAANKLPYTGSLSRDDLASYGVFGLMRAIDSFEVARGHRFSTYATWWIRQAILRALADYGRTIRLPVHRVDQLGRARKAEEQHTLSLGREPTTEELAALASGNEPPLAQLNKWANLTVSLERTIVADESLHIADTIADEGAAAAFERVDDRAACEAALAGLSAREQRAVRLIYGLDGMPLGLAEVGRELGITRERVRQIVYEAITKMRLAVYGSSHSDIGERLDYLIISGKGFVVRDKLAFTEWLQTKGFVWQAEAGEWWRSSGEGVRVSHLGWVLCLGRDKMKVQELLASHART